MRSRRSALLFLPLFGVCALLAMLLALSSTTPDGIALASFLAPAQDFRDVAGVRVWADTIVQVTDRITATGNVNLGPAGTDQRWFSISGPAIAVTTTNRITLTGQLAMVGSSQLLSGTFPVNAATGELSVPLDAL
ncbi:MAG: hypothetical protein KDE31_18565, partial [Caldilineaceae bacterium]|nr:hypothetical protein [Caldilineaceae bacterium]